MLPEDDKNEVPLKIDLILPLRVEVAGRENDLYRVISGLIPSLVLNNYHLITSRFTIISPESDFEQLGQIANRFPQFHFDFISDESLVNHLGFQPDKFAKIPGWFKQQLLKLAAISRCGCELVLVLDSDVIATAFPPIKSLLSGVVPYQKMGVGAFGSWFETSAAALAIEYDSIPSLELANAIGVTPEFLSRSVTKDLVNRLSGLSGSVAWGPYLMGFTKDYQKTWTEFSLYWIWYVASGRQHVNHVPTSFYTFVENPDAVQKVSLNNERYFTVLQSTKLSHAECEPIYSYFNELLTRDGIT